MDALGNPLGPLSYTTGQIVLDQTTTWHPNGQEIGFSRRISGQPFFELYKTSVPGGVQTKLTGSTGNDFDELNPSWSFAGSVIAVASEVDRDFDIWLVDPNGGGYLTNLTDSSSNVESWPAFGWTP